MTSRPTRRDCLSWGLSLGPLALCPSWVRGQSALRFSEDPFSLGVASGFPTSDSVVLWTRLAPDPLAAGGGMPDLMVPVRWQVAEDPRMRHLVTGGTALALPEDAHSVHVEPVGLRPRRDYWYRFVAGGVESPVGDTRTAPAEVDALSRLKLAACSCQMYEHGYYNAYRAMLEDDLDLIVHVGDYIYEGSWGENPVRSHGTPEARTLDDYRARYALYKTDPDLRAAHEAFAWIATWDDHEVSNDYANDISNRDDPPEEFLQRRAAAYRAYYEHLPLPRAAKPRGPDALIYTERAYGDLARFYVLDGRQYRTPHACPPPGRRGGGRVSNCAELDDPRRTMLGTRQRDWLLGRLGASRSRWNVLAQQTVMAYMDEDPGPGERFATDSWSGYPGERALLMDFLAESSVPNPIVLSGDIHAFVVADLNQRPADLESPIVAAELTSTSITSQALPQRTLNEMTRGNANIKLGDAEHRGYVRLDLDRERARADLVAMQTVRTRDPRSGVLASFEIEAGRPGVRPVSA